MPGSERMLNIYSNGAHLRIICFICKCFFSQLVSGIDGTLYRVYRENLAPVIKCLARYNYVTTDLISNRRLLMKYGTNVFPIKGF